MRSVRIPTCRRIPDATSEIAPGGGVSRLASNLRRRSAASRIGVSGFLMSCAIERAASTHAASRSARRKSVRSSRRRITRGPRSSPGSVTIATRKKRSPEGPGMVDARLVGRRPHGRFLESRPERRPSGARQALVERASWQQAIRRRIREEDGSVVPAEEQDGRREISEKADGGGTLLGERLRALLDARRHLGERVDEAREIHVGRPHERRQRTPLADVRGGRDELLERPPQRERRPAAEAHGRERDRHGEQKQGVGRRPHGLVFGDDDRERLAPVAARRPRRPRRRAAPRARARRATRTPTAVLPRAPARSGTASLSRATSAATGSARDAATSVPSR